jgi:hypothetical protein
MRMTPRVRRDIQPIHVEAKLFDSFVQGVHLRLRGFAVGPADDRYRGGILSASALLRPRSVGMLLNATPDYATTVPSLPRRRR